MVTVTIRAKIDTGNLDERIRALEENKDVANDLRTMAAEMAALRKELDALKAQTRSKSASPEKTNPALQEKEQETIRKMITADNIREAGIAVKKGNNKEAIALLDPVLKENPENFLARILLGSAYYKQGDLDRAETEIDRAIAIEPNAARAIALKGAIALNRGDNREAVHLTSQALRLKPDCRKCYLVRGYALWRLKQGRRAYLNFKKACDMDLARACDMVRKIEARQKQKSQRQ